MINTNNFAISPAAISFIKVSIFSVFMGLIFGWINHKIFVKAKDATLATILSLVIPLFAYSGAEYFHISGVLTVVTCGLYVSYYYFEVNSLNIKTRIKEFWEVMIYILNAAVFIVLGLQLPEITHKFSSIELQHLICAGLLLSCVVILGRIIWMFPIASLRVWINNRRGIFDDRLDKKFFSEIFIGSWSGMRGVVSLAAALAIPETLNNNTQFPMRNEILLITFIVILFTLIVQSISLPIIIRKLK